MKKQIKKIEKRIEQIEKAVSVYKQGHGYL